MKRICKNCGKEFDDPSTTKPAMYCSSKCFREHRRKVFVPRDSLEEHLSESMAAGMSYGKYMMTKEKKK